LTLPAIEPVAAVHDETRAVVLDAPATCPRYCGRIVRGVNAKAPTPDWMKQRIERCGVRSISALVDVTNYVMLELGQPLHAFDDAVLQGAIHVRYPNPDEQLLLLNEQTVTPSLTTALIADDVKPLAMAGIMGGEHSGIGANTARMMLSAISPDDLQQAILNGNTALLQSIKGIGTKTAQRVIIDLRDKIGKEKFSGEIFPVKDNRLKDEALSALVILGFNKGEADKVISKILLAEKNLPLEDLIKKALKQL
jgi:phenylalanyl-tRNA synthetase beta subunit